MFTYLAIQPHYFSSFLLVYSFNLPDGSRLELTFIANEEGYQPQSAAIPTPHPLPPHVIELLAVVEQLKREGATWDEQGFRLTRRK